jgi:transcriptional regulator with XRE-family HTH domain
VVVPASPEARRDAFSRFVQRALTQAKQSRGWSIPKVAEVSGVGQNTIYRWVKADWREFPKGELVEQFCDALDIPVAAAFGILWPGKTARPSATEPQPAEPEFDALMRKLRDPNVPDTEKYLIRETIRSLASRPNRPTDTRKDRRVG